MAKLSAFIFLSLDGRYKGEAEDISWHFHGPEENAHAVDMMAAGNILIFGRITYELMASFWPTDYAKETDPEVAKGMNASEKIVFSRQLQESDWENTQIVHQDPVSYLQALKSNSKKDLCILGSGNLVQQLADARLIDEYQILLDPIILGKGISFLEGLEENLKLKLISSRPLQSGSILLKYQAY